MLKQDAICQGNAFVLLMGVFFASDSLTTSGTGIAVMVGIVIIAAVLIWVPHMEFDRKGEQMWAYFMTLLRRKKRKAC
jgi:zinc transporter ZupT